MSRQKLIESLQKDADDRITMLWKDVDAEADKIRTETKTRAGQIKEEFRKKQAKAVKEQEEAILNEAKNSTRAMKLVVENKLSDRLYSLAVSQLNELRSEGYRDIFSLLKKELPPLEWKTVRICPDDAEIARGLFPDSELISDSGIRGGMETATEDNSICINNTFEKRLERIWEDILPQLIKAVYEEVSGDGTDSSPPK